MATPQAAGLATYLLAIKPGLSVQKLNEILLITAEAVPSSTNAACSNAAASPVINAYSAVLALDEESAVASGDKPRAVVRHAILDIALSDGTTEEPDGRFDEGDLIFFINKIEEGNDDFVEGKGVATYGRADLNGDGYVGGRENKKRFNLDANYPPSFEYAVQTIEERSIHFNEDSLSDDDILCYYAYSDLYVGDSEQRKSLMEGRCFTGKLAVYYADSVENDFPGYTSSCEGDSTEEIAEENLDTIPAPFEPGIRPSSHYWLNGDSHLFAEGLSSSQVRGRGLVGSVCQPMGTFFADASINSSLAVDPVPGQE